MIQNDFCSIFESNLGLPKTFLHLTSLKKGTVLMHLNKQLCLLHQWYDSRSFHQYMWRWVSRSLQSWFILDNGSLLFPSLHYDKSYIFNKRYWRLNHFQNPSLKNKYAQPVIFQRLFIEFEKWCISEQFHGMILYLIYIKNILIHFLFIFK